MKKQIRWLHGEIEQWMAEGLITLGQAEGIRARYRQPEGGTPWATIIFSSLGAAILGLGIVLMFAYNWNAIPKFGKLGIVFGLLLLAHGGGAWLFLRGGRYRGVGEALCLLGTVLYGSGIWLIAQIYHIDTHYPNGFLAWGLGALAAAWALASIPQAIAALALLSIWSATETVMFERFIHLGPVMIAALVAPLAWWKRSRLLMAAATVGLVFSACVGAAAAHEGTHLILVCLLSLGGLLLALAQLAPSIPSLAPFSRIWDRSGWIAFFSALYLLTFPGLIDEVLPLGLSKHGLAALSWLVPLAAAFLVWTIVVLGMTRFDRRLSFDLYLVPLVLVVTLLLLFFRTGDWLATPFNLAFLTLAISLMMRGCRQPNARLTIVGSVLLVMLATARYMDLFDSLIARGAVFILVGAVIFGQGLLYTRRKRAAGTGFGAGVQEVSR